MAGARDFRKYSVWQEVDEKGVLTYEVLMDKIHSIERQLNGLINSIRKG